MRDSYGVVLCGEHYHDKDFDGVNSSHEDVENYMKKIKGLQGDFKEISELMSIVGFLKFRISNSVTLKEKAEIEKAIKTIVDCILKTLKSLFEA